MIFQDPRLRFVQQMVNTYIDKDSNFKPVSNSILDCMGTRRSIVVRSMKKSVAVTMPMLSN